MFFSDKCNNSSADGDELEEGFWKHKADYQDMLQEKNHSMHGIDEDMEYDGVYGARRTLSQLTN